MIRNVPHRFTCRSSALRNGKGPSRIVVASLICSMYMSGCKSVAGAPAISANQASPIPPSALQAIDALIAKSGEVRTTWPGFWTPPRFGVYRPTAGIVVYYAGQQLRGYSTLQHPLITGRANDRVLVFNGSWNLLNGGPVPILPDLVPGASVESGITIPDDPERLPVALAVEADSFPVLLETLLHESFHSLQLARFNGVYQAGASLPVDTSRLTDQHHRDLVGERDALMAAVLARSSAESACQTQRYLELRRKRVQNESTELIEAERRLEWHEGTATYVGVLGMLIVQGKKDSFADTLVQRVNSRWLSGGSRKSDQVRARAYLSGAAMAAILDRHLPRWHQEVERGERLDKLVARISCSDSSK